LSERAAEFAQDPQGDGAGPVATAVAGAAALGLVEKWMQRFNRSGSESSLSANASHVR
jgi:hypothetical protein